MPSIIDYQSTFSTKSAAYFDDWSMLGEKQS